MPLLFIFFSGGGVPGHAGEQRSSGLRSGGSERDGSLLLCSDCKAAAHQVSSLTILFTKCPLNYVIVALMVLTDTFQKIFKSQDTIYNSESSGSWMIFQTFLNEFLFPFPVMNT